MLIIVYSYFCGRHNDVGIMSVASKYFYKAVENCTCADFMHAGTANCWESTLWNLSQTITGCCKYVFPIAIVYPKSETFFALLSINIDKLSIIYV